MFVGLGVIIVCFNNSVWLGRMDIDHMAAAPGEWPEKVNVSWRGHHTLNSDTHVCSWGGNFKIFDSSR